MGSCFESRLWATHYVHQLLSVYQVPWSLQPTHDQWLALYFYYYFCYVDKELRLGEGVCPRSQNYEG